MYEELPVTLLGRLAIDARWRGYALGPMLLAKAFEKILAAAQQVASIGVVVDPVNERIAHWYQQMGFLALHTLPGAEEVASEPVPQLPGRLYLPMKGVKQLVEAASG